MNFRSVLYRSFAACGMLFGLLSSPISLSAIWTTPQVISHPGQPTRNDNSPVSVVNSRGNAIAVWTDARALFDPTSVSISSAFYTFGVGWSPAVYISNLSLNMFGFPLYNAQGDCSVDMNSSNYAVAAWEASFNQPPDFPLAIVYATSINGVWSPAANLVTDADNNINNVNVAMNEAGTTIATWRKIDGDTSFTTRIASFLPFGGSWSTPVTISLNEDGTSGNAKPFPEINPSGDAVVTWSGEIFPNDVIGVATYNATTSSWSPPVYLETSSFGVGPNPRCAIFDNGNAIVVWANSTSAGGATSQIKASFFDGTTWQTPIVISPGIATVSILSPDVVIDSTGIATALFQSIAGDVYSTSRQANGLWTAPQIISTGVNTFVPNPSQIALAAAQQDLGAIWTDDPETTLFANFSFGDQLWQMQEFITTVGALDFIPNRNIGLTTCGFAVAVWDVINQSTLVGAVYASIRQNSFLVENARVRQCSENFATQKRCVSTLTWDPNPCAVSFNIFRNGILLATVPGSQSSFIDIFCCCKGPFVYTITFINAAGFESAPVLFNVVP